MGGSAPAEAHAGEVIGGRFRVEAELGEGGMAQVFRVTDVVTQKPYALKLLKKSISGEGEAMARLRREGEVLAALDTPAVVKIETFGKLPDDRLFLVMELLEGETLGDRMRREKKLTPQQLVPIVTGAAAGLAAAHAGGVIHRDLKPDNIFLERSTQDEPLQVKLLDFGISKVYGVEERLTRTGQILGTPRYMAPEQLAADHDLDGRVDGYALGVILYEALAGVPPFAATSPSDLIVAILHGKITPLPSLRPDLPPELCAVVMRAMARAREARYATPHELADAFIDSVGGLPRQSGRNSGSKGTEVLGGRAVAAPAPSKEASLRVGTFSELETASPADSVQTSMGKKPPQKRGGFAPTTPLRVSRPDAIAGPAPTSGSQPTGPASGSHPTDTSGGASGSYPAGLPSGDYDVSGETSLPTNNRALWIVAALIAGGLSAAGAIFLLGDPNPDRNSAPSVPATVAANPAPPEVTETEMESAPIPIGAMPEPIEPRAEDPVADDEPRMRRRRSGSRRNMSDDMGGSDVPDPFVSDVVMVEAVMRANPVADARQALRDGDPEQCLQILSSARARGPLALRLEGDCHLRSGKRDDAVKAYEQFCRQYPEHDAIAAIRGLTQSLGGYCP